MSVKSILSSISHISAQRKSAIINAPDALTIKGKAYYVSNDGCDENSGLSSKAPIKTLEKASNLPLCEGDGILFRRGDIFRGKLMAKDGVSYGAYGVGDKPKLYGWDFSLASPEIWELYDEKCRIWKMKKEILDVGTLVFNDGEGHSRKLIPSYINGRFVCRDNTEKVFDMRVEMTRDLDIYWHFDRFFNTKSSKGESTPIPDVESPRAFGELYLRCDSGNPGEIFSSLEALPRRHGIDVGGHKNVRIDNLCLKYIGCHAVAAGGKNVCGLTVTNCEIGWIGGTVQHYNGTDPNYPEGRRGTVTRYGNGVEIYGGCDGYEVSSCYIYEIYDAAVTHQITTNGDKYEMKNILYSGNLIENCVYGVEYFLEMNCGDKDSFMENVLIKDNIIRETGGWGMQRHNTYTPAAIKSWSFENRAQNFVIENNVFDRSQKQLLHICSTHRDNLPKMSGNVYIQTSGGTFGQYGECPAKMIVCDENAEKEIKELFSDENVKLYII